MATLFEDNLENGLGNFSVTGTVTLTTTNPLEGSYSAQTIATATGDRNYLFASFSALARVFSQFKFRLDSAPAVGTRVSILTFMSAGQYAVGSFGVENVDGNLLWYIIKENTVRATSGPVVGQTYTLECLEDAAVGLELFVDGESVLTSPDVSGESMNAIRVGCAYPTGAVACTVDAIIVADSYIGVTTGNHIVLTVYYTEVALPTIDVAANVPVTFTITRVS